MKSLSPARKTLRLEYLVADFNGTLACDGALLPGAGEALVRLAEKFVVRMRHRDIPLRIRFWNGTETDVDTDPVMTLTLPTVTAHRRGSDMIGC